MITLFHSPGSCSNGLLLLLEEVGADYEVEVLPIIEGAHRTESYLALNPKGKIPALRLDDGTVLTEFQSIAQYIVDTHPEAGLAPADPLARAQLCAAMDYIVASLHMRGYSFIKRPARFVEDASAHEAISAHGHEQVAQASALLSDMLGEQEYLLGDFSAADAALYFTSRWADGDGVTLPENLAAHLDRVRARPSHAAVAHLMQR
ncbi:glutathione S-transferase family protein [Pseudooceanicola nanhaiensis]|uniref:glutathione S-transferase family protein n=1 Tax=Pseudooceanicola nanhaiensis TaxID=375761 RepID=UPI001CD21B05|nr:glutathione S-transferase family protein [Pseudooceanicola nanhaiensis]MCA0922526.1 glutathione S-transferase family protein [Pseudooceanicola nanhaiensis]